MLIYLILLPLLSLIIWVVPPLVIREIYKARYQKLHDSIKRRDLAIRAIVKNPDEYASIGQVERVTDLIEEIKEQIAQEDSVLVEISAKLEQTQHYVEEQERINVNQTESDKGSINSPDATLNRLQAEIEASISELGTLTSKLEGGSDEDMAQLKQFEDALEASKELLEKAAKVEAVG